MRMPRAELSSRPNLFVVVFNALCVLCGAMSLNQQDFAAVVFDSARIRDDVRRGLEIIRLIGNSRNGVKVRQSKSFLKKLMRATLHSNKTVRFSSRR